VLGLGTSSPAIVQDWSGVALERPVQRLRDAVILLRPMLAGQKVTAQSETLRVTNFRLGRPSDPPVPIYLAALRPRMLQLAGALGDGVILNLLTADEVPRVVAIAREAARRAGRDPAALQVACRIFLCPTRQHAEGDEVARRFLAGYLTAPTYIAFQGWLGHGEELQPALDAWATGDRRRALRELPQALVDEWVYVGPPEACREKVLAYCENGVDIPILQLFRAESDPVDNTYALRAMAPPA
jgi:probable F420-dependent oxidoreductase